MYLSAPIISIMPLRCQLIHLTSNITRKSGSKTLEKLETKHSKKWKQNTRKTRNKTLEKVETKLSKKWK